MVTRRSDGPMPSRTSTNIVYGRSSPNTLPTRLERPADTPLAFSMSLRDKQKKTILSVSNSWWTTRVVTLG